MSTIFRFMKTLNVYTISYTKDIAENLEEGYLLLDNIENKRPDWREYWPIRNYLINNILDETSFYGFFSPKFQAKTGLAFQQLQKFITTSWDDTDVFVISPQIEVGALFQNEYFGGDLMSPGFLEVSQKILDRNKILVDLGELFTDTRTTAFSNYIVARPCYWRKWLAIGEMYFKVAENINGTDPLTRQLNQITTYAGDVHRKVFVIEALASLILHLNKDLRVKTFNPFDLPSSALFSKYQDEALLCDALKTAYIEQKFPIHRETFNRLSLETLKRANVAQQDPYMLKKYEFDQVDQLLLNFIPLDSKRILDVGCARGRLAKEHKTRNADAYWVGIDIDHDYIEAAKNNCDEAYCLDAETLSPDDFERFGQFDVCIFGNTLGSLRDPWRFLSRLRQHLKSSSVIIISSPNIQHWSFQLGLNSGEFPYNHHSYIDRTSLRIFTRSTLLSMLNGAGFVMIQGMSQSKSHPDIEKILTQIRATAFINNTDPEQAVNDSLIHYLYIKASPVNATD